ncbi:hypothetical protein [Williamsoniiplasma lucivorax]|uniref:Uncharacterized protein n=1 Tax=Williamsoniiplasma lucivorax TaxID=209274 RepID=A0A2S5RF79_9MOLU|nr:hypothetical protein [Williamsoniiplasma lucivorax]PPE05948.1 hypothetical protein ELUCI_v1c02390 [Williamsoniiplasma lucivorax]
MSKSKKLDKEADILWSEIKDQEKNILKSAKFKKEVSGTEPGQINLTALLGKAEEVYMGRAPKTDLEIMLNEADKILNSNKQEPETQKQIKIQTNKK